MSWLPRILWTGADLTDDLGPDAEGRMLSIEWRGVIVELAIYRRAPRSPAVLSLFPAEDAGARGLAPLRSGAERTQPYYSPADEPER